MGEARLGFPVLSTILHRDTLNPGSSPLQYGTVINCCLQCLTNTLLEEQLHVANHGESLLVGLRSSLRISYVGFVALFVAEELLLIVRLTIPERYRLSDCAFTVWQLRRAIEPDGT
jgi:hypothetical protein